MSEEQKTCQSEKVSEKKKRTEVRAPRLCVAVDHSQDLRGMQESQHSGLSPRSLSFSWIIHPSASPSLPKRQKKKKKILSDFLSNSFWNWPPQ